MDTHGEGQRKEKRSQNDEVRELISQNGGRCLTLSGVAVNGPHAVFSHGEIGNGA